TFMEHCANEPDEPLVPQSQVARRNARVALVSIAIAIFAIAASVLFIFGYLDRLSGSQKTPTLVGWKRHVFVPEIVPMAPIPPTTRAAAPAAGTSAPVAGGDRRAWPGHVDESKLKIISGRTGRLYHVPTCDVGRQILLVNLLTYESAAEAEAAGKQPCAQGIQNLAPTSVAAPREPCERAGRRDPRQRWFTSMGRSRVERARGPVARAASA